MTTNRFPDELPEKLTGLAGAAELVAIDGEHQSGAGLGSYLIDAPGQAPAWDQYVLGLVSLVGPASEGWPAFLQYPGAEFELMLLALDPHGVVDLLAAGPPAGEEMESVRYTADGETPFAHLTPANYVHQFDGVTDQGAASILGRCAGKIVDGTAPAEPAFPGGRMEWAPILRVELEVARRRFGR